MTKKVCKCEECGLVVEAVDCDRVHHRCKTDTRVVPSPVAPVVELPSLVARIGHYGLSVGAWIAKGRPVRSDEEIEKLLDICEECEHHGRDKRGTPVCAKCGCCTNNRHSGWVNKLAMATEKCPVGKW